MNLISCWKSLNNNLISITLYQPAGTRYNIPFLINKPDTGKRTNHSPLINWPKKIILKAII